MEPIPAHLDHPVYRLKCSPCEMLQHPVGQCEKYHCAFAQQRRGYEGRQRDDARLAEERSRKLSQEEGGDGGQKGLQCQDLYAREILKDFSEPPASRLISDQEVTPASLSGARVCGRSSFPLPPSCQGEDTDERR